MQYKGKTYSLLPAEEMLTKDAGSCKGCAFDYELQCPGTDSTFMNVDGNIACEPNRIPMIFKERE
jgi:hypothetical protein